MMLRYRPSLEFSLPTASSQSAAILPYNPEAFVVTRNATSREKNVLSSSPQDGTLGGPQPQLKSLLNFACRVNEYERAAISLETFLKQVRTERDGVEAALEEQIPVIKTSATVQKDISDDREGCCYKLCDEPDWDEICGTRSCLRQ